jgi:hypothetical protein
MTRLFDAGHQQLFTAECSGLRSTWRRAAELSARRGHVARIDEQAPWEWASARWPLRGAVAMLLVGLQTLPLELHARHVFEAGICVDPRAATDPGRA